MKVIQTAEIIQNYPVVKSNDLIEFSSSDLTTIEYKLVMIVTALINNKIEDMFETKVVPISTITELLGHNSTHNNYAWLKDLVQQLRSKTVTIIYGDPEDPEELICSWLTGTLANLRSGTIRFRFASDLKPYLLELEKKYTSYPLYKVIKLKSKSTIRLYEYLLKVYNLRTYKRNTKDISFVISILELRKILWLDILVEVEDEDTKKKKKVWKRSYTNYGNLKHAILTKAQEDFTRNSIGLYFDFKEIKNGKKVVELEFIVKAENTRKKLIHSIG